MINSDDMIDLQEIAFRTTSVIYTAYDNMIAFDIFGTIAAVKPEYRALGDYRFTTGNKMYYTNNEPCGVSIEVVVLDFRCGERLQVKSQTKTECITTFEMEKWCPGQGGFMENDIAYTDVTIFPVDEIEEDFENIELDFETECDFNCKKTRNNETCGRIRPPKNSDVELDNTNPILTFPNKCEFRQTRCVLRKKAERDCTAAEYRNGNQICSRKEYRKYHSKLSYQDCSAK